MQNSNFGPGIQPANMPPAEPEKSSVGTIAILIAVLAILAGAFGYWWMYMSNADVTNPAVPALDTNQQTNQIPPPESDSTTIIDQDLKAVNEGSLDADFQGVDQDLKAL